MVLSKFSFSLDLVSFLQPLISILLLHLLSCLVYVHAIILFFLLRFLNLLSILVYFHIIYQPFLQYFIFSLMFKSDLYQV